MHQKNDILKEPDRFGEESMKNTKKKYKISPKKLSITPTKKINHDQDFFKWTMVQARFLKNKEFSNLDIDNLIEEIEALGRSEARTLESHLANLFLHLLKIKYQPGKHTRSWDLSVQNAEYHAKKVYAQNPSLAQHLPEIFKDAYYTARLKAIDETGLEEDLFPTTCLWKIKEIFPTPKTVKVKPKKKK